MLFLNAFIKAFFGIPFFLLPFSGLSPLTAFLGLLGLSLILGALCDAVSGIGRVLDFLSRVAEGEEIHHI